MQENDEDDDMRRRRRGSDDPAPIGMKDMHGNSMGAAFHPPPSIRPGMAPTSTTFAPPSNMPRQPMGMRPMGPRGPGPQMGGPGGPPMSMFGGLGGIAPTDGK